MEPVQVETAKEIPGRMCEYCGCQQITAIGELTREHDEVVAAISRVRGALDAGRPDEIVRWCRRISAVLGPHTVVEEDGLFPALEADFPGHVERLRGEHRQLEAVLDEAAERMPVDPAWPDRLRRALFVLREHILAEQDGVFPAALAGLGPEQWDRVDEVRARVGGALQAQPG